MKVQQHCEGRTREARLSEEPERWMRKLRGNSSALERSASSVGGVTGGCPAAARGVRKGDDTPESTAAGLPPPPRGALNELL